MLNKYRKTIFTLLQEPSSHVIRMYTHNLCKKEQHVLSLQKKVGASTWINMGFQAHI